MYSVYGDGVCIYDDLHMSKNVSAVTPKLKMADNSAGSFEITLPVGNAGYDILERLSSEIVIKQFDEEIWSGRIIEEKKNFQNSRILTCEGELAYLNDTTQPPAEYEEMEVYDFLLELLNKHNEKAGDNRQFTIGAVTVHESCARTTNDETTMEVINTQLVKKLGGHIRVRKTDGVRYLDYLEDYPNTNAQEIRFGENLLDLTQNWDATKLATVIVPRGAKLDESPFDSLDAYLDVSSVNGGSRYVTNEEAIAVRGWVEKVVDWNDITDPAELLTKAKAYLEEEQFDEMVIKASAVDLRYVTEDAVSIHLLDRVRCVSRPHGMDKIFPVTELSIQLDKPDNSTYTLGDKVKTNTLTGASKAANDEIKEKISKIPDEKTILDKAADNASEILNLATHGHVTIVKNDSGSEALAISDTMTYDPQTDKWSPQTRLWRWNINGLGYSKDGGRTFTNAAITMDGQIVANFITTGTMQAERIRSGILQDDKNNVNWNLTTGVLTMKKGSITLGISSSFPNGRFSVDDYGYLTAQHGTIGGFTITAGDIHNDVINLNSYGLEFYESGDALGNYGTGYWKKNPSVQGMTVSLEPNTGYISWGYRESESANTYTTKLMYTSVDLLGDDGDTWVGDRIHLGCDLDGHNWLAYNFFIDPLTGGCNDGANHRNVKIPFRISSDGTISSYIECDLQNGFLAAR